jgi:hypothetical protein
MVQYIVFVEGEMKNRKIIKEKHAVAGVIEALLLVGLVAVILSVIQLLYIPQVMEQREADHMDEVANQFSFLKSIIDLQSMTQEDVPISSPITLGSRELPYFVTARAEGEVQIVENAGEIEVDFVTIAPLTSIRYTAFNCYYPRNTASNIIYELEGGTIIVKQPDGEPVRRVDASIIVENRTSSINIFYEIPIIIGLPGKDSSGLSYKTCFVRTNFSSSDDNWISITDISNIRITSSYPNAWNESLSNIQDLGKNVNITKGSNYVEITSKSKEIHFHYKRIYIYAQVSPGWI